MATSAFQLRIEDHSKEITEEMEKALLVALEECGLQAETFAKKLAPTDTGLLKNSITHALSGKGASISSYKADKGGKKGSYSGTAPNDDIPAVYIGTNVEYAAFVELGHLSKKGEHIAAQPFLKPAVADHADAYRRVIENALKKG